MSNFLFELFLAYLCCAGLGTITALIVVNRLESKPKTKDSWDGTKSAEELQREARLNEQNRIDVDAEVQAHTFEDMMEDAQHYLTTPGVTRPWEEVKMAYPHLNELVKAVPAPKTKLSKSKKPKESKILAMVKETKKDLGLVKSKKTRPSKANAKTVGPKLKWRKSSYNSDTHFAEWENYELSLIDETDAGFAFTLFIIPFGKARIEQILEVVTFKDAKEEALLALEEVIAKETRKKTRRNQLVWKKGLTWGNEPGYVARDGKYELSLAEVSDDGREFNLDIVHDDMSFVCDKHISNSSLKEAKQIAKAELDRVKGEAAP